MPLKYNIVEHTSNKRKTDNQGELHAIKKLKTCHISREDTIKQKEKNDKL